MGNIVSTDHESKLSKRLKLLTFEDNKIISNFDAISKIKDEFNFPIYIISLIGEARFGKSTLINCFGTVLLNKNVNICPVRSTNDHCTIGIDICVVKEESKDYGFMFLDCQGINHMDSSNDAKLLIVPYEISNLIIYNEKDINNSTLKSLEPMLLFEKYIDDIDSKKSDKPILVIRARDYSLDDPIESVLEDMLTSRKDQYESIRKMIKKLFSKITAINTDIISKEQLLKFKENDFKSVVDDESTNFKNACIKIIDLIQETKLKVINDKFIDKFKIIIKQVNNDEKIDYKKLDLLGLWLKSELNDFMKDEKVDDDLMKKKHDVQLTAQFFNDSRKRLNKFTDIYAKFCRMFEKSDKDITKPYFDDFEKRGDELSLNFETCKSGLLKNLYTILNDILLKHAHDISVYTKSHHRTSESIDFNVKNVIEFVKKIFINRTQDHPQELTAYIINEYIEKELFDLLKKTFSTHYEELNSAIEERKMKSMTFLKNKLLILDNINELCIDVYKPFEEQPFIKNIYDAWDQKWSKRKDTYLYFYLDLEIEDGKLKYEKIYMSGYTIDIVLYSNDAGYKSLINKFINSTEVIDKYNLLVSNKLDEILDKDCNITGKHDLILANKNVTFYYFDTGKYDYLFNCKSGMLFTLNGFKKFINEYFTCVDPRFDLDCMILLFDRGDLGYKNMIAIDLDKSKTHKSEYYPQRIYFCNKIKKYHLERIFMDKFPTKTPV